MLFFLELGPNRDDRVNGGEGQMLWLQWGRGWPNLVDGLRKGPIPRADESRQREAITEKNRTMLFGLSIELWSLMF